jgi:hypothetical protein
MVETLFMNCDDELSQNSAVLIRYTKLQQQGKNPALAIYRGRRLIITSYRPEGILERISLIFNKILISLLKFLRIIETNEDAIKKLKESVYEFYFNQVQINKLQELQELLAEHRKQVQAFEAEKTAAVRDFVAVIEKDFKSLKEIKQNLEEEINKLQKEADRFRKSVHEPTEEKSTKETPTEVNEKFNAETQTKIIEKADAETQTEQKFPENAKPMNGLPSTNKRDFITLNGVKKDFNKLFQSVRDKLNS